MRAYISFPGFYSSWISPDSLIESRRECDADYLTRECGFSEEECAAYFDACNDVFDFSAYAEKAGRRYCDEYESMLQDLDDSLIDVKLTFIAIRSPREYNFISDSCEVEISAHDMRLIRKYAADILREEDTGDTYRLSENRITTRAAALESAKSAGYISLESYIFERLRARDGFIPHYSNDVRQWGAVNQWGCAQTECLFDFILSSREVMGLDCVNESLISDCEGYAVTDDPDPAQWIEAYRAEKAREEKEKEEEEERARIERRAAPLYLFLNRRDFESMTIGAFEDKYCAGHSFDAYERGDIPQIDEVIEFTTKQQAYTHARYLAQCGYISAARADDMAKMIEAA